MSTTPSCEVVVPASSCPSCASLTSCLTVQSCLSINNYVLQPLRSSIIPDVGTPSSRYSFLPPFPGHGVVTLLLVEMLQSIETELQRYERVVNYWPVYAPKLEAAVCTVLRVVTAAVTRQCGLLPSRHVHRPASFGRTPARYGTLVTCVVGWRVGSDQRGPG